MEKLALFLTTAFIAGNGFCMDSSQLNEEDFDRWSILVTQDTVAANTFLEQKHEERIRRSAERDQYGAPAAYGYEIAPIGHAVYQGPVVDDPITVFADNPQQLMEYFTFQEQNPDATPAEFILREQQRIADNRAAEQADLNLFALENTQERMLGLAIAEQREYIENYVATRADYSVIQQQRAHFVPILTACIAVNPTNAQDLNVHLYDGFYNAHNAAVLNIIRTLRLGENEGGQIRFDATQARDRAVTILRENGQEHSINSVAAQLPGYFAGLSGDDSELFCRLVGTVSDFVEHGSPDFTHYLLGIPENWLTQGGCVEGRRNRNLVSTVTLLRTLVLEA